MKVLSIKEPFASLIKNNIKYIETRSWKINYRGKIYIHACKSKIEKDIYSRPELVELIKNITPMYGKIICSCELVDCIYMDEEYIEKIKKEEPIQYASGKYKVGRYAWILKNIEVFESPIDAKGNLGLWTYHPEVEDEN